MANGPRRRDQPALPRQDLVEPPAGDVGEGEQPQGLAGRRAVDDDHVVVAARVVGADLQQAEELVHARRDGQLLGGDAEDAAVGEDPAEPVADGGPVRLELGLRLDLLGPEQRRDLARLGTELLLERIAEAVGGIGREDDRPQAGARHSGERSPRRRSSCRRLPCPCRGSSSGDSARSHRRPAPIQGTLTAPDRAGRAPGSLRARTTITLLLLAALAALVAAAGMRRQRRLRRRPAGGARQGARRRRGHRQRRSRHHPRRRVDAAGRQGNLNAEVKGPFQSNGTGNLPSVDLDVTASIDSGDTSFDFDGGLTITGDGAWVGFQGDEYQLDDATFQAVKASYEQSASQQSGQDQGSLEQFGIDPQSWVTDLTNEGTEDLDGTEVVHVSGTADVPKLIADLNDVAQQTGQATNLDPGALKQLEDTVTDATIDVYAAEDDYSLRKIEIGLTLADPRGGSGEVTVDLGDRHLRPGAPTVDRARPPTRSRSTTSSSQIPGGAAALGGLGSGAGSAAQSTPPPAGLQQRPEVLRLRRRRRRPRRRSTTARACSADERPRTGSEQGLLPRSRRMALPAGAVHPAGDRARHRRRLGGDRSSSRRRSGSSRRRR